MFVAAQGALTCVVGTPPRVTIQTAISSVCATLDAGLGAFRALRALMQPFAVAVEGIFDLIVADFHPILRTDLPRFVPSVALDTKQLYILGETLVTTYGMP